MWGTSKAGMGLLVSRTLVQRVLWQQYYRSDPCGRMAPVLKDSELASKSKAIDRKTELETLNHSIRLAM